MQNQILIALTGSSDEEVQSIACYDIGEFVRYYPNGRAIAKNLGAKDIVLKLVDHSNEELSRHALTCVSKIMVQNWQVRRCCLKMIVARIPLQLTDDAPLSFCRLFISTEALYRVLIFAIYSCW